MKPKTTVKKSFIPIDQKTHWSVLIEIDHQGFTLTPSEDTKKMATWYKKQLDAAFSRLEETTITEYLISTNENCGKEKKKI